LQKNTKITFLIEKILVICEDHILWKEYGAGMVSGLLLGLADTHNGTKLVKMITKLPKTDFSGSRKKGNLAHFVHFSNNCGE
jgi:hypothetical protein